MATTTNYGWVTPDDTALVKDGAAAIRTLGSSADTTTKNLNPETTLGDISFRSSTSNVNTRLGIGTAGQVLTVVGGLPAYAAPASGGKVLQIISAKYATQTSTSTSTFVDTGLTANITPTSASNKIIIFANVAGCAKASSNTGVSLKLFRDATEVGKFADSSGNTDNSNHNFVGTQSASYLDVPATTSAITYKVQFNSSSNSATAFVQINNGESTILLMEVAP